MKKLSARQQAMYRFIQEYVQEHGLPPTHREIGEALHMKTTSHVDYHLRQLEQHGLIKRIAHAARGILPEAGVAVQGRVAAGQTLEIFARHEQYVDLARYAPHRRAYLVQVQGLSMIGDHIADGDYVLIDPDAAIEQGDIVVACERGDAASEQGAVTLKRFYREPHQIELRPSNPDMASRFIPAKEWDRQWNLQGKVKAVFRLFDQS
jgi:repressor LexA